MAIRQIPVSMVKYQAIHIATCSSDGKTIILGSVVLEGLEMSDSQNSSRFEKFSLDLSSAIGLQAWEIVKSIHTVDNFMIMEVRIDGDIGYELPATDNVINDDIAAIDVDCNCRIVAFKIDTRTGGLLHLFSLPLPNDQQFLQIYISNCCSDRKICIGLSTSTCQYILSFSDKESVLMSDFNEELVLESAGNIERVNLAINSVKETLYKCFEISFKLLNVGDLSKISSTIDSTLRFASEIVGLLEEISLEKISLDLSALVHDFHIFEGNKILLKLSSKDVEIKLRMEIKPNLLFSVQYLKMISFLASLVCVATDSESLAEFNISLVTKKVFDEFFGDIFSRWSLEIAGILLSSYVEFPEFLISTMFLFILRVTAESTVYTNLNPPMSEYKVYSIEYHI